MGRYPAYPAYSDSRVSWLGLTPIEWEIKRVANCFKIHNGSTPKSNEEAFWDGDIVWITPDDLGRNMGKCIGDSRRKITFEGYLSCGTSLAPPGSIVLSTRAPIGHLARTTVPACANQGCRILEPTEGDPDYWYYVGIAAKQELQSLGLGTTFLELPRHSLGVVELPVPSLFEQQAIARFLDYKTAQIDTLIAKRNSLLDKLAEKCTALITQAVTKGLDPSVAMKHSGTPGLQEIPAAWRTSRLKHATHSITDGTHVTPTYIDEGVPFLRVTDIVQAGNGEIDLSSVKMIPPAEHAVLARRCNPEKGDILYSKNGTIGVPRVVTWDFKFSIFVSLCLIKVDQQKIVPEFLYYSLLAKSIQSQIATGAKSNTVTNLHLDKIKEFWVCIPSLSEQREIVSYLERATDRIDQQRSKIQQAIDALKEYRTALVASAVTGKIDVRNFHFPEPLAAEVPHA
jgi:type I restriction enzyme, S subunit